MTARRFVPPRETATHSLGYQGGKATPEQGRAISALIEELLCIDETDENAVHELLGHHFFGRENNAPDEYRKLVEDARLFLAALPRALVGDPWSTRRVHASVAKLRAVQPHKRPRNIAERRRRLMHSLGEYLRDPDGPARPPFGVDAVTYSGLERFANELVDLDPHLMRSPRSEPLAELVRRITPALRKAPTIELAAARLSRELNVFEDGSKGTVKEVKAHYAKAKRI